jgi:hypothetical protein
MIRVGAGLDGGAGARPALAGILFLLALAIPAIPARAGEVEVKATLEPEVIGIDQTAVFTIEVRGEGVSSLRFRPSLQLDNLEDAGGPSQFEDMRWTNGHFTRTFRLSWQLRPQGLGKAGVHNVTVQIQDKQVQLPDREIRVQKEPTPQAQPQRNRDDEDDPFKQFFGRMPIPHWRPEQPQEPVVFLRAEVQPQQPVVGQQVLYTIYLFTREDIANIAPAGLPAFKGFWVQDIPIPQHPPMEMVELDGRRYGRVPLIQKALFPLGAFAIEGATLDLTVEHYDRSLFFGPAIARPETVRLRTEGQTLNVQPLPPAPPGFAGAVGQLALTARLEPQQLRLGEAATLTVQLGGSGNLQGLPEPKVTAPSGLTLYPPQREGKDEIAGTTVRGRRSWSYVVVPGRTGSYRLEAPRVPYFDPVSREYRTATAPALDLTALPRPKVGFVGAGSSEPHPVRTAALAARNLGSRRWARLLPWLFALPSGLALVFLLLRRRPVHTGNPSHAGPAARLEQALAEVAAERPRQVAARLEEAWREFLAERWEISRSTPAAKWSTVLAGHQVDDASLAEVEALLDELDYLRHAPQLSTTDTLRAEALARSRRLLRQLH